MSATTNNNRLSGPSFWNVITIALLLAVGIAILFDVSPFRRNASPSDAVSNAPSAPPEDSTVCWFEDDGETERCNTQSAIAAQIARLASGTIAQEQIMVDDGLECRWTDATNKAFCEGFIDTIKQRRANGYYDNHRGQNGAWGLR